ncbi:MAG: hypothetical protein JWO58_3230 [Chitinophagaceae bacterium]|nr:hypothetical protein [Chitinophagaceae bacterium]
MGIIFNSQAQSVTAKNSIDQIENERLELNRLQERIKAKQDSLIRERIKIEEEQKKVEAARRAALVVQTPAKVEPQPKIEPVKIRKRLVKNSVGIAPVHMYITGFEAFYERAIGKKISLVLSGGYHGMENFPRPNSSSGSSSSSTTTLGTAFLEGDKVAYYGVRLQLQLRAYLFEEPMHWRNCISLPRFYISTMNS